MELGLIKLELQRLIDKVESTQELFTTPYPNFTAQENLELISKLYSMFKGHLESLFDDLKKKEAKSQLNVNEEAFWFPAINESLLELKERKNSKNEFKLGDNFYSCSMILSHYHSQIDV